MTWAWNFSSFAEAPLEIIDGDRGTDYPKHTDFADEGFCVFLNAGNVSKSGFDFSKIQFIDQAKDDQLRNGKLKRNDVVMTTRGTIGNVAHYALNTPFENVRINSGMVIFRCDPVELLPHYLYHFLRTPHFHEQTNSLRSGVAQPQLPIRDIRRIELPLPPLEVQTRIAEYISSYDELIENNRRRMALLEESARLLYREWFVRLRFPGHEHTNVTDGVPNGWSIRTIGDCSVFQSGGTPSKGNADFWDGVIPWISSGEMTSLRIIDSSLHVTPEAVKDGSRLVPKDTILVVVRGMSLAKEFRLAMTGRPVAFNQDLKALTCVEDVTPEFLFSALVARRDEIRDRATEASHGTKNSTLQCSRPSQFSYPTRISSNCIPRCYSP